MQRLLIGFWVFVILFSRGVQAQPFKTTWYDSEKGLPSEVVKAMAQDTMGFIWIASDEGIARFDGTQFTSYQQRLSSNFVKGFRVLSNGQLLAVTDMGIDIINSQPDTVIIKPLISGDIQPSLTSLTYPKTIFEDSHQSIWIGENSGVSRIKDGKLRKYAFPSSESSTSFVYAFSFVENPQGELFTSSYNGTIYQYDSPNELFIPYQLDMKIPNVTGLLFEGNKLLVVGYSGFFELTLDKKRRKAKVKRLTDLKWVTCIYKSVTGEIFLGTRNDGLYIVTYHNGAIETQSVQEMDDGRVSSIIDDQAGGLWVGTHKGIAHLHQSFFRSIMFEEQKSYIQDIATHDNGDVFFAVGREIYRLSKKYAQWEQEKVWAYFNSYAMRIALIDNQLLIGLSSGSLQQLDLQTGEIKNIVITDANPQYNTFINTLFVDDKRRVWTSKNGLQGVYCFEYDSPTAVQYFGPKNGLLDDVIHTKSNKKGDLYFLTSSVKRPLYRYNSENQSFTPLPFPSSLCNMDIHYEDFDFVNDSIIALATSCGLWKYNIPQQALELVNIESIDGFALENKGYHSIVALPNDNYLLGSKAGIIFTHQQQGLHYDESSGLPTNTINARNLLLDRNNRLWVGTVEGAAMANYHSVNPKATPAPIITSIKRNGEKELLHKFKDNIKLPFGSYLEIQFSALIFPSHSIRYQYRILGKDSLWLSTNKKTDIFVPQLPDGNYTFQVRAYHPNGYKWSQPASLSFRIQKAWYLQSWMFIIYFVLLIAAVYGVVRLNTWRLLRAKNKLEKIVQQRMAESIEQNRLLNQQKEEIERQRDDIQKKNKWLEEAHQTIEQKNAELLSVNHELEAKVKQRTSELDQALVELQRYNAELDYFIYRAAHDLRGPIARIMGLANLIRMQNGDEEIRLYVDRMDLTLKEMSSMLSRLMETLELKSNKIVLQPIKVDDFLEQTLEFFSESELQATIDVPESLLIYGDFELLERMFENLFQNTIDFKDQTQEAAQVQIQASVAENEKQVVIQLTDAGRGILKEAHDHIFDMFYVGAEDSKGAGLGLYEVAVIMERLHGTINLISSERGKTVFEITLPIYEKSLH